MKQEEYPEKINIAKKEFDKVGKDDYYDDVIVWDGAAKDDAHIEYIRSDIFHNLIDKEYKVGLAEGERMAWEEMDDEIPKWHKYPDEKPIGSGEYLITLKGYDEEFNSTCYFTYMCYYHSTIDTWEINNSLHNVIAWAELPKPYKD